MQLRLQNPTRLAVVATLVTVLLAGIWLCSRDLAFFVRNLPDDGFYYLIVARNLAAGLGPTFDGITRTNGFHPLLGFLLAGIFRATPQSELGDLRVAAALGLLCHLLTGWLVVLSLRQLGRKRHAALGGILYWLNPYAFLRASSAMEGPLYALGLAGLLYLLLRLAQREAAAAPRVWRTLTVGLAAGLTLLARTDAVLLVPFLGLLLALPRDRRRPDGKAALLLAAGVALVLLPWVVYSLERFGTLFQYSGAVKTWERWQSLARVGPAAALLEVVDGLRIWFQKTLLTAPLAKYLLLAFLLRGRWRPAWRSWWRTLPPPLKAYLGFVAALGLFYGMNFELIRGWYLVPASVLMSVLTVDALHRCPPLRHFWRSPVARRVVIALVLAESLLYPAVKLRRGIQREQTDTYAMVEWAAGHLDPDARIGSFNAGIPAYFLDNPVVNLDGLMNNEMLEVMQGRDLGGYLRRRQIRYLLDHEHKWPMIRHLAGAAWAEAHLRELQSLPGRARDRRLVIWEVDGQGD